MKSRKKNTSVQINILFILTTLFIALCLFLPVWQSTLSEDLKISLAKEEKKLSTLQDQRTVLQASIEKNKSADEVLKRAGLINLDFSLLKTARSNVFASTI